MATTVVPPPQMQPQQVGQPGQPMPQVPPGPRSIYVGDLNPDVTEQNLFEKFNEVGPVLSIRICRDAVTRNSLGYAYVNFQNPADAERALDTMNFELIKGRPCRLMWCQRDPSLRRENKGNIFIKNLPESIDNKTLYDTFSRFGDILSCKVECTLEGKSRGFGYVHFKSEQSAQDAIEKVNGMMLQIEGVPSDNQKPLFVGVFKPRAARGEGDADRKYTNLYVRGFPVSFTKDKLDALFSKFGTIKSSIVATRRNDDGTESSRQFGFVDFENPDSAAAARDAMNDFDVEGLKLVVTRAQKKRERVMMLKRKYEEERIKRRQQTRPFNLYVKYIDPAYTDDQFTELFKPFGNITSARIMRSPQGESKGFGFVCFSTKDEATNALTNLNGKMVGRKPLYVCNAQTKEERRQFLESRYRMRPTYGAPIPYAPTPYPFYPTPMRMMTPMPRRYPYVAQNFPRNAPPMVPGGRPPVRMPAQPVRGMQRPPMHTQMTYAQSARQPDLLNQLRNANPDEQRRILGGALFRSMQVDNEDKRRKITGMLVELDQSEILHLLDDPAALQEKVAEASSLIGNSA